MYFLTKPRKIQPIAGGARIDPGNRFGQRARIFLYPHTNQIAYDAVTNTYYRIGVSATTSGNRSLRGLSGNIVWSGVRCPPDLLTSKPQTILLALRGLSDTYTPGSNNRLFDVSSGSGWRLGVTRQSATTVNVQTFSFADTGAVNTIVTADPRQPMVVGATFTNAGSNNARMYLAQFAGSTIPSQNGFIGTDTVTVDADAAGADTRLDALGSNGSDVEFFLAAWFAGALSDAEMYDLMANPWQCLRAAKAPVFDVAASGVVLSRYYYDMAA